MEKLILLVSEYLCLYQMELLEYNNIVMKNNAFNPFKVHTHSSEHTHTHTVNTHPEQWAAIYTAF